MSPEVSKSVSSMPEQFFKDNNYHDYRAHGSNHLPCVAPIALISLPGSRDFTVKVDRHLYNRRLQYLEERTLTIDDEPGFLRDSYIMRSHAVRFSSGEGKGTLEDSIRGHDVYIICDVLNHSIEFSMFGKSVPMGPDDHFQDLIRMLLATNGKARRLTVIMPFLYQSRQVVRSARESLDCAHMLKQLDKLRASSIVSFDPHDSRIENALPQNALDSFPVSYQQIKALCKTYRDLDFTTERAMMVISPDESGMKRAMYYATVMGLPLGTFYRNRDFSDQSLRKASGVEFLGDSPAGRDVLIVDDMINTGHTMIETARQLKKQKARRVFCLASFAPMVDGTEGMEEAVKAGYIDRVFSTNLIYNRPDLLAAAWYVQTDMTKTVALIIDAMNHNASISSLLDQTSRIRRLLRHYQETQNLF